MDIDTTTLYDTILDQPWCLSLESTTTANKVLLVTMKGQLTMACEWVDNQLLEIYQQHISDKLDVTTLQDHLCIPDVCQPPETMYFHHYRHPH